MKKIISKLTLGLLSVIIIGAGCSQNAAQYTPAPVTTEPTPQTSTPNPTPSGTSFTMSDVATHNTGSSCYTVVNGSVYDVTNWINQHPGGSGAILSMCGKDGTTAFDNQHGGQRRPESELASFKIGTLAQ